MRRFGSSGKAEGIPPAFADRLFSNSWLDYLILEADGAAGRPLKAPADHEPVIPPSATVTVGSMGLESLGKALHEDVVFRADRFGTVVGLEQGEELTPKGVSRIFVNPGGVFRGAPCQARRIPFLNKLDLLPRELEAKELAGRLLESSMDRVVMASILKRHYVVMKRR
jgi:probable selenium-dependent hydroxylase accessory protein YqeC